MAKVKTQPDQCPKCRTHHPDAKFCPACGLLIGHTGKPGRPFSKDKGCQIYGWVPEAVRAEIQKYLEKDETESAFFRAAIDRELKVRKRRDA